MLARAVRTDLAAELEVAVQFAAPRLGVARARTAPVGSLGRHPARPAAAAITQARQRRRVQSQPAHQDLGPGDRRHAGAEKREHPGYASGQRRLAPHVPPQCRDVARLADDGDPLIPVEGFGEPGENRRRRVARAGPIDQFPDARAKPRPRPQWRRRIRAHLQDGIDRTGCEKMRTESRDDPARRTRETDRGVRGPAATEHAHRPPDGIDVPVRRRSVQTDPGTEGDDTREVALRQPLCHRAREPAVGRSHLDGGHYSGTQAASGAEAGCDDLVEGTEPGQAAATMRATRSV